MLPRITNTARLGIKNLYQLNHIKSFHNATIAHKAQVMNDESQYVVKTDRIYSYFNFYIQSYKPTYTIEFDRIGEVLLYSCDPHKHLTIFLKYPYVLYETAIPLSIYLWFKNPLDIAWYYYYRYFNHTGTIYLYMHHHFCGFQECGIGDHYTLQYYIIILLYHEYIIIQFIVIYITYILYIIYYINYIQYIQYLQKIYYIIYIYHISKILKNEVQYKIQRLSLLRGGKVLKIETNTLANDKNVYWVETYQFHPLTADLTQFDDRDNADYLTEEGQLKYELACQLDHIQELGTTVQDEVIYFMKEGIVHHPELFEAATKGYVQQKCLDLYRYF